VNINITIFLDVTQHSFMDTFQCFRGTCYHHLQSSTLKIFIHINIQYLSSKFQEQYWSLRNDVTQSLERHRPHAATYLSTELLEITSEKTAIFNYCPIFRCVLVPWYSHDRHVNTRSKNICASLQHAPPPPNTYTN
jgi:hypothetical protein